MSEINYRKNNNYYVYVHISPSNKYYVGITKLKPTQRWGKNGCGYKKQGFYNAIQKYGWNNFEHEIIAEHLTEEEACNMEIALIKALNSDGENGYNNHCGGHYKYSGIEDLTGKTFGNLIVNKKLYIKRNINGVPITYYDCICSCGNHTIKNNNIKYGSNTSWYCPECIKRNAYNKHCKNYKTKNFIEEKDDVLLIHNLSSNDIIICSNQYKDIINQYTFRIEYKNEQPSRVRGYNTSLHNKSDLNLEDILYKDKYSFDYIIFKNDHLDYREENLFFVDTSTFTFYHHLFNNHNNPMYLIRTYKHKNCIKYFVDHKLLKKLPYAYKSFRSNNLQDIIVERNKILNMIASNNEALKYVVSLFYTSNLQKEAA